MYNVRLKADEKEVNVGGEKQDQNASPISISIA